MVKKLPQPDLGPKNGKKIPTKMSINGPGAPARARVRPWSMGPGPDQGPALVHGPRPRSAALAGWLTRAPQYRFFIVFMRNVIQKGIVNGELLGHLGSFWAIWGLIWRTWGAK